MQRFVRPRPATVFVVALALACLALAGGSATEPGSQTFGFAPLAASLVVVGSFLTLRMAGNPIGRLLLAWGVVVSYTCGIGAWDVASGERAGIVQRWLTVPIGVLWHPAFSLFVLAVLVFPHGRLLARRWRIAAVAAVTWSVLLAVSALLSPRSTFADYAPHTRPPYRSPLEGLGTAGFQLLLGLIMVLLLVAVTSLVLRWKRASGDDRRQVTVFVFPTSAALVLFVVSLLTVGDGRYGFILFAVLPVSLAIAVTRYRLYEIDTIVSRTVSYAIVTAVVVGVYVGGVELVGLALPDAGGVGVAAATLAAAAVFTPVRRRVQRWVDRRFNRDRYDREQLVEEFRLRLRHPDDVGDVTDELLDAVGRTLHPATTSVWVRG